MVAQISRAPAHTWLQKTALGPRGEGQGRKAWCLEEGPGGRLRAAPKVWWGLGEPWHRSWEGLLVAPPARPAAELVR